MRLFLLFICCSVTIASAYWAYKENYKTQATLKQVNTLHTKIGQEREAISVLKAEWAYLNRPERLRELVDLNFADLKLVPLSSEHFDETDNIAFPRTLQDVVNAPIETQGQSEGGNP